MKKISLLPLFLSLGTICAKAQELRINSVEHMPHDLSAVNNPVLDSNEDTCALLIINTPGIRGLEFPNKNQYSRAISLGSTYYVYISPLAGRRLDFRHESYLPIQLDIQDYGIRRLKGGNTYIVELKEIAEAAEVNKIIVNVKPTNSEVYIDGLLIDKKENGKYEIDTSDGMHQYSVKSPYYESQQGAIYLAPLEVKVLSVNLKATYQNMNVNCNVKNAHIFVDDIDYGRVGKIALPQGMHYIRIQADGYVDDERTMEISPAVLSINCELKENKEIKHINPVAITVVTNSAHIYKNNKRIKGWKKGTPVMMMPGKYELSDGYGHFKRIIVEEDTPQTISFY